MIIRHCMWRPASDFRDRPEDIPPGLDPTAPAKLVFNKAQIGRAHLWFDKHLSAGYWISDELGEALCIGDAIARSGDSPYVFPPPSGTRPITAHAATRALGRARGSLGLEHFRVHDLRRTVATGMASLGINPHTISLVLDRISVTKGTMTGAVYVKYSFDREKREALSAWTERLDLILSHNGLPRKSSVCARKAEVLRRSEAT